MSKKFLVFSLAAAGLIVALSSYSPGQQLVGLSPTAQVSAGRASLAQSEIGFTNWVTLDFRHCQKYVKETGFWFWKKSTVDTEACNADPTTLYHAQVRENLVTDAGFDFATKVLSDTAAQPASCNYVAVTNDATGADATDTALPAEITTNGLARAIGTFAHTTGTKVYTVTKVFTATGPQQSQMTGLLNAAAAGTLCYEVAYTPVTVNNNDTLTVTWTVTLS